MKSKKDRAITSAEATARNHNRQKQHYHNKPLLSRTNRNISTQTQRRQYQEVANQWFTKLLILTSEQARVKGNLKLANYYVWLAETATTNPRGGIVI